MYQKEGEWLDFKSSERYAERWPASRHDKRSGDQEPLAQLAVRLTAASSSNKVTRTAWSASAAPWANKAP